MRARLPLQYLLLGGNRPLPLLRSMVRPHCHTHLRSRPIKLLRALQRLQRLGSGSSQCMLPAQLALQPAIENQQTAWPSAADTNRKTR